MASSVNSVTVMGRLTRDPELRQTPSGQSVCSFSLAVGRRYKNPAGEWVDATDFIDCVAWAGLGETISKYVKKGQRLLVQGRLSFRSWEKDGQKHSKLEVLATDMTFIESAGDGGSRGDDGADYEASSPSKDVVVTELDDAPIDLKDIPF